jgi:hypothetical protein
MKAVDRPTQITTFLKTVSSKDDGEIRTELETYIADLEAKQPDRPTRIAAILRTIGSQYPADVRAFLEDYVSDLEARQQTVLPGGNHIPAWDPNNPPIWSHERSVQRDHHIREHAWKKQNHYR